MRPLWTGVVSFGLLNVPVRLYTASDEDPIRFVYVHKKDKGRIRYSRVCEQEDAEVPYEEISRAYKTSDGKCVLLSNEDFDRVNREKTSKIEIVHFSKSDEVEAPYFEKPYWVAPQKDADEPYILLKEALEAEDAVAVVKFVLRTKERVGVLMSWHGALIVNQLRYAREVRSPELLPLPKGKARKKELKIARDLINTLVKPFNLEEHRDYYRKDILALIAAKKKGKKVKVKGEKATATPKRNIMEALTESLKKEKVKVQ